MNRLLAILDTAAKGGAAQFGKSVVVFGLAYLIQWVASIQPETPEQGFLWGAALALVVGALK
jgi:hypothetical protein